MYKDIKLKAGEQLVCAMDGRSFKFDTVLVITNKRAETVKFQPYQSTDQEGKDGTVYKAGRRSGVLTLSIHELRYVINDQLADFCNDGGEAIFVKSADKLTVGEKAVAEKVKTELRLKDKPKAEEDEMDRIRRILFGDVEREDQEEEQEEIEEQEIEITEEEFNKLTGKTADEPKKQAKTEDENLKEIRRKLGLD